MNEHAQTWLQCTASHPAPAHYLVCFPHAGGSASFFKDWRGALHSAAVYGVRYPGRGERIDEPPPVDLLQLAHEAAEAIETLAHRPITLFGHSMGAVVALEVARHLEARGVRIHHLFASGTRDGECAVRGQQGGIADDDDSLAQQLVELGGTDPALSSDPTFRELVLPYVRGDGHMFHAYRMQPEPLLRCDVTTIAGDLDEAADVRPWSRLTTGTFRHHQPRGNHFYLVSEPPFELLRQRLGSRNRSSATLSPKAEDEHA